MNNVTNLIIELEKKGIVAYLVGGAVRDHLLGLKIVDFDLAYYKSSDVNIEDLGFKILEEYTRKFHSYKLKISDVAFDLTHLRVETYDKYRHPKTELTDDIGLDALRRDFKINAIYMDANGLIIDPLNGVSDLKNKLIDTCKDPMISFEEDPLRMLRAIKFKNRLNFSFSKRLNDALILKQGLISHVLKSSKKDLEEILKNKSWIDDLLVFDQFKKYRQVFDFYQKVDISLEELYLLMNLEHPLFIEYPKGFNKLLERLKNIKNNFSNYLVYCNYDIIKKVDLMVKFYELTYELPIQKRMDIDISYDELSKIVGKTKVNIYFKIIEQNILELRLQNNNGDILRFLESEKCK